MNSTLDEIPNSGDTILIRNLNGSLELAQFPFGRRPYTVNDFQNWWNNYSDQEFFAFWIKIDATIKRKQRHTA